MSFSAATLVISIIGCLCPFSSAFQGVYTTDRTSSSNHIHRLHAQQSQDYLESTTYGASAPYREANYDPVSDQYVGEKLIHCLYSYSIWLSYLFCYVPIFFSTRRAIIASSSKILQR